MGLRLNRTFDQGEEPSIWWYATKLMCDTICAILIPLFRLRSKHIRVLHISTFVHIAHYTKQILLSHGLEVGYLAKGQEAKGFFQPDYFFRSRGDISSKERLRELLMVMKMAMKYDIIHSHFMHPITYDGWELKFWKLWGKKWVVHARGCEVRDREVNMKAFPCMNICQVCDYNATICQNPLNKQRKQLVNKYADSILSTTPDMLLFLPDRAEHIPFFTPPDSKSAQTAGRVYKKGDTLKIMHVTNHPGIEGTAEIKEIIEQLRNEGLAIDFDFYSGVSNDEVLNNYKNYHLTIGKMKMGYYANAQIESLYNGVPSITYVRDEYLTDEIRNSGLILSSLDMLSETLRGIYSSPEILEEKRIVAKSSVEKLHNNAKLAMKYKDVYASILNKRFFE